MLHRSFKLEFFLYHFSLETSLIHLGASPDIIGKFSRPLKEAILEVQTFSLNCDKSESKLQGALDTSIFIQYVSVIPFWKALDIHISKNKFILTSEVNRGRQRLPKMKKMTLITFFDKVVPTPNFKLKPSGQYICLLYTSPSPRDRTRSRMPSSA